MKSILTSQVHVHVFKQYLLGLMNLLSLFFSQASFSQPAVSLGEAGKFAILGLNNGTLKSSVKILMYDNLGKVVKMQSAIVQKGITEIELNNLGQFNGGVYIIEVNTPAKSTRIKLLK